MLINSKLNISRRFKVNLYFNKRFDIFPAFTELKKIIRIIPSVKAPRPKIPQVLIEKTTKIPQVLT
jgi:hypothetical protein